MAYPKNVGIKAMEIYVPAQCLDQTLFEQHQGVSAGKYTIGLGLQYMNFCTDREDVCSLALTAVSSLLRKFNIDPKSIGRLEVGTESPIDKAKSVKSVLTTLFEPHGNTSLEGIDTTHACYGGTNALFNAVNWVESRSWDGRDAIVVASDIALYKEAASRPTGGAGCVAMLVGPNALLSLESGLKGVYMTHAYDFYKPDTKVEFPIVNGHESIGCYIGALDAFLELFDYMAFHTPNCKLYNDCLLSTDDAEWEGIPDELRKLSYSESLKDKTLEKTLIEITKDEFKKRVEPCIAGASLCGNMYTGSLYFSLMSLINNIDLKAAEGKTIGLFSFGSGIASSLFGMKITGDLTDLVQKVNLMDRLKQRHTATPEEYEEACTLRRNAYGAKDFRPLGDVNSLVPGTYYLENVDDVYRRTYAIKK
ncbi:hypothetical protein BPOR_0008g00430 [Botrytis porri]|uniref:Hydroxymethylglutaryl-CoA synthase n=1 Tax=Botrytis porri TaxID=87229 RepID=A0A4Z1L6T0_9HELO|nr:hypothetical protein BPOR_0008g00430 [Botrytis porri]